MQTTPARHLPLSIALLVLVACLAGCGGRTDATAGAPAVSSPGARVNTSAATPVAEASIGPTGGTLTCQKFKLVVPASAFAKTQTLKLYRRVRSASAEPGCVSDTFSISGLPGTISKALTVTVTPLAGETTGGFSFIAMGGETFTPSAGNVDAQQPRQAHLVDGKLVATIPATPAPSAGANEHDMGTLQAATNSVSYSAFSKWRALMSGMGHFRVIYHPASCSEDQAARIARSAETAWTNIGSIYRMSWARRTVWPVDIEVHALSDPDIAAQQVGSVWGVNSAYLEVDSGHVGAANLGPVIQHEVFHLAQSLFDPRNRYSAAKFPSPWYWMEEATATFFEYTCNRELSTPPAPIPLPYVLDPQGLYDAITKHSLEFPPGKPVAVRHHGYSHSMFIHSLWPSIGEQGIGELFARHYANPALSPVGALVEQLGTTVDLERAFLDYVDEWVRGRIFAGHRFPTANQVRMTCKERIPLGWQHLSGTATANLGDLSIFPVLIVPEGAPPPGASVLVSIKGLPPVDAEALLYGCAGINFTTLNIGSPRVILDYGDAAQYLLVIANVSVTTPYTSSPEVTVGLQIKPMFTSASPKSGKPGTHVVIRGYGFGAAQGAASLSMDNYGPGPTEIAPTLWSNTRVEFDVPDTHLYNDDYIVTLLVPGPAQPDHQPKDSFVFHLDAP